MAIAFLAGLISACGESSNSGSSSSSSNASPKLEGDLYKLARMNGCIDCHRVKATVIGPSWQDIADRYKDAPREQAREILVERVKKGSKGNWITWKAPEGMPPMEKRVSEEHIIQLVDYIISLNRAPGADAPPAG